MRLIESLLGMALILTIPSPAFTMSSGSDVEKNEESLEVTGDGIKAKASKAAKQEAKKFTKEGWETTPGALPLERQFDRSFNMQYERDEYGNLKFLIGEAMSIGENYDAAKMQALELSKQNLAGQIQTEITAIIENSVNNDQLGQDEAASLTKTVLEGKSLISNSIGRIIPVVECYRTKSNKNKEVLVRVAYSVDMAKSVAKRAIHKTLENENEELRKKLEEILEW